jgi:hypothetical protein
MSYIYAFNHPELHSGKECQQKQLASSERRLSSLPIRGQFDLGRISIMSMQREISHVCRTFSPLSTKLLFNQERKLPSKTEYDGLKLRKLGITTRAKYQPERYEITGGSLEPIGSSPEEVMLPWWQQFPKRWTIVLLCFFAFLLCNMDRVSTIYNLYQYCTILELDSFCLFVLLLNIRLFCKNDLVAQVVTN